MDPGHERLLVHIFGPKKVELVEFECFEAFLREVGARCELRRVGRERRKGEEVVFGTALNNTKALREGSSDRLNLSCCFLV